MWPGLGATEPSASLRPGVQRLGKTTPQAQEPEEPTPGTTDTEDEEPAHTRPWDHGH